MVSIDDYRQAVEYLASRKKDFDIHNEGNDCAKVIFATIFNNAKQEICIVANNLRNPVVDSPEYQNALDVFLGNKNSKLRIIVSNIPDTAKDKSNDNIYRRLCLNPAYNEGRIHIRNANRSCFKIDGQPVNFCVADDLMTRIEIDIEKRNAVCNFGKSSRAKKLEDAFNQVFNRLNTDVDLSLLFA